MNMVVYNNSGYSQGLSDVYLLPNNSVNFVDMNLLIPNATKNKTAMIWQSPIIRGTNVYSANATCI